MNIADIIASLQKFWSESGPTAVITLFPGVKLDVSRETEWIELWPHQLQEYPSRDSSPNQWSMLLDLHLFAQTENKRAIYVTLDEVQDALTNKSISITSSNNVELIVGTMRFQEPIIRDFTRLETLGTTKATQHTLISYQAIATAISH